MFYAGVRVFGLFHLPSQQVILRCGSNRIHAIEDGGHVLAVGEEGVRRMRLHTPEALARRWTPWIEILALTLATKTSVNALLTLP